MRVETKITNLLNSIEGLSEVDRNNIIEYLSYNESGVAFDILCTQIYEYEIDISKENYEFIKQIGMEMKLKPSSWEYLKELII